MPGKAWQVASIVFTALVLLLLTVGLVRIIDQKGVIGGLFASDIVAGVLALVAAWLGTKPNSSIRSILILAIFFFFLARIAQYMLL